MPTVERHFTPELFAFLGDLRRNNDRAWFQANKTRYEEAAQHPALQFVSDFGPELRKISRAFVADPRPVGGSLFRIYRDTRFARDKSPYKTHLGIHFRHRDAKDAHTPGFYLHLEPGACFAGIGIWRPDAPSLARLRAALIDKPKAWQKAVSAKPFVSVYTLEGDSLKRPPKGFDPDHPLIEDLKRTDFVAVAKLTDKQVTAKGFLDGYVALCKAGTPFMKWVCGALGVGW